MNRSGYDDDNDYMDMEAQRASASLPASKTRQRKKVLLKDSSDEENDDQHVATNLPQRSAHVAKAAASPRRLPTTPQIPRNSNSSNSSTNSSSNSSPAVTSTREDDEIKKRQQCQEIMQARRRRKSILTTPLATASAAKAAGYSMDSGGVVSSDSSYIPWTKEEEEKYEEWMKIAADNKINASNSWSANLIDYFCNMAQSDTQGNVNFQKASCTLDGCVKIYTTRVDSVASETGKLLSGLEEDIIDRKKVKKEEEDENGVQASGSEDEGEDGMKKPHKKKRSAETLERSFLPITLKTIETEYCIDPLFQKMSSDFDEGGSRALLLNCLSISRDGRIMFDSSIVENDDDVPLTISKENDGAEVTVEEIKSKVNSTLIDISELKAKFFTESLQEFRMRTICPSLANFSWSDSGTFELPAHLKEHMAESEDAIEQKAEIFLHHQQQMEEDPFFFGGDDGGFAGPSDDEGHGPSLAEMMNRNGSNLKLQIVNSLEKEPAGEFYSYFDTALLKNWAGPEHWKVPSAIRRKVQDADDDAEEDGDVKKTRIRKEPVKINFAESDDDQKKKCDPKSLFLKATPLSCISLAASTFDENFAKNLLPDDLHFSSKELARLFIRPSWSVMKEKAAPRGKVGDTAEENGDNPQNEYAADGAFWAGEGSHENGLRLGAVDMTDHNNGGDAAGDYGFGGAPDVFPDSDSEDGDRLNNFAEEELLIPTFESAFGDYDLDEAGALVDKPIIVNTMKMNYAKTSKIVDVGRLKENLWHNIVSMDDHRPVQPGLETPQVTSVTVADEKEIAPTTFTDVVSSLTKCYSAKKIADISVPFCFICLLHLANEHSLEIKAPSDNELEQLIIQRSGQH